MLLGIPSRKAAGQPRTASMRDALERVAKFVTSSASTRDLATLIDMRDGTVHVAQSSQVEEPLVVAFLQHAEALIADLVLIVPRSGAGSLK